MSISRSGAREIVVLRCMCVIEYFFIWRMYKRRKQCINSRIAAGLGA